MLEDANIKLDSVIANVLGKSGRAMLEALAAGESNPDQLLALAHPGLKSPKDKLRAALDGRVKPHHRFLLRLHLSQIDALDVAIAAIDQEVDDNLAPFRAAVELLTSIFGVSTLSAQVIISEIGTDMSRFAVPADDEHVPRPGAGEPELVTVVATRSSGRRS